MDPIFTNAEKENIKQFIKNYPNCYHQQIKPYAKKLYQKIILIENTRNFAEKCYIAVHGRIGICTRSGCENHTYFDSYMLGYRRYCGLSCKQIGKTPGNKGISPPDHIREKLRIANLGKKPWNTGLTKETSEKMRRLSKKLSDYRKIHPQEFSKESREKRSNTMMGREVSKETREKISKSNKGKRLGMKMSDESRLKMKKSHMGRRNTLHLRGFSPNYNPSGCQILNEHMQASGSFIQHAENGGEFYIKGLGYWVDGYDVVNNIVYEIDEPNHYRNQKVIEKDLQRQNEITSLLNCKFIRIKL